MPYVNVRITKDGSRADAFPPGDSVHYQVTLMLSLTRLFAGKGELVAQTADPVPAKQPELWKQVASQFAIPYVQVRTGALGPKYAVNQASRLPGEDL